MSDEKNDQSHVRKTVSLTHRQIGATGLIGLAVALMPYLKESFVPKSDGERTTVELQYIRRDITNLQSSVEQGRKDILDAFASSERRTGKTEERLERRIDTLEAAIRPKNKNY